MQTLKKGNKGEEVKKLLQLLGIQADGVFGPATEKAVKDFLKKKGLVSDGIVGQKTWEALGVKEANNSKCVDPSVIYLPLSAHVSRFVGRPIKYLAIHYTAGGSSAPGSAKNIKGVFEKRLASADFAVDDRDMVQFNPDIKNYYCWAVGDKKVDKVNCPDGKNNNTISIEVCSTLKKGTSAAVPNHEGWTFADAALNNAVKLAKILMKKYNIPIERVVRHYDISGKKCPGIIGWNDGLIYDTYGNKTTRKNNSDKWKAFKERLKG